MKNIIFAIPFLMGSHAFAQAPQYTFEKLADVRNKFVLSDLSADEKTIIVDQARMILKDIFVHRDLKIQNFGPTADPLPALMEIKNKIPSLSTVEFHKQMISAFHRMNDWHTTYQLPKPYSCYRTLLPAGFKAVKDEFGKEVIGVDTMTTKPEILSLLSPDVKIEAGDILVSYNGLTPAQALANNIPLSYGANPAAVKRDSVFALGFISNKFAFVPEKDSVTLTLKDKEGNLKTISVPWLVKGDTKCLNPQLEVTGDQGAKDFQTEFNQIQRKTRKHNFKAPGDLLESREPILRYKVINNEYGSFGYLRLDSFVPEKLKSMETVEEIKRLLEGPLSKTEGIIIDLRSNGGGQIVIGEAMVQLFNPKNTVPLNFALKNSAPNRLFWETTDAQSSFNLELKKAEAEGRALTTPIPLHSPASLNKLGQSIIKPIAVFINASCYSTCDMFSASMQDLGAGIIIGEDPNTGAGGANNWRHSIFTNELPEDNQGPFVKLPGGIEIGFSYRQTSRTGSHAGELIEDVGVKADMIVEATTKDLDTSEAQLRTITRKLAEEADKFTSSVEMKVPATDIRLNQRPSVDLKWEDTTSIDIRVNGLNKGSIDLETSNTTGRNIILPEFVSTATPEHQFIELMGRLDGKKVWRKVFNLRTIPEPIVISKANPLVLDFAESMNPLVAYNKNSAAEKGWKVTQGTLRISESGNYASNLHSTATLFAKISDATTLNFRASVNSEENYDYLCTYILSGSEESNRSCLSGDKEAKDYSIDLSSFKGKEIEIRFEFTSDGNKEGTGPVIESLEIK